MPFEAFVQASAFCSPPTTGRPASSRQKRQPWQNVQSRQRAALQDNSLPLPLPPPTSLAQAKRLGRQDHSAGKTPVFSGRPISAREVGSYVVAKEGRGDSRRVAKDVQELLLQPPAAKEDQEDAAGAPDGSTQVHASWRKQPSLRTDMLDANTLPSDEQAVDHQTSAPSSPRSQVRRGRGRGRGKDAADVLYAFEHRKMMTVLQYRHQCTRHVQSRIQAFDRRAQDLAGRSRGRRIDHLHGSLFADTSSDAIGSCLGGKQDASNAGTDDEEEETARLDELPFKIVEWSSQRGNFPATNLTEDTRSCWQSDIGRVKDQHVTFELEIMPVPVTAISFELVTKETSPKRCKVMYATRTAVGPWTLAWSFVVPEKAIEDGVFTSIQPEKADQESVVAPWWRLVVHDNLGSKVCVSIGAPLKLWSSHVGEKIHLKYWRKSKVTFLEGHLAAGFNLTGLTPEERIEKRYEVAYGMDQHFIKSMRVLFMEVDKSNQGFWSRGAWQTFMMGFLQPNHRSKVSNDRLDFFWHLIDKDDSGNLDFEELLLFVHAIESCAERDGKTIPEFLYPNVYPGSSAHARPPRPRGDASESQAPDTPGPSSLDAVTAVAANLSKQQGEKQGEKQQTGPHLPHVGKTVLSAVLAFKQKAGTPSAEPAEPTVLSQNEAIKMATQTMVRSRRREEDFCKGESYAAILKRQELYAVSSPSNAKRYGSA